MSPAENPERSPLAAAKAAARHAARSARCDLGANECAHAAERVAEALLALPELAEAHVVLGYGATPEELDPALALAELTALGVTIAYPRIEAPGVLGIHTVLDPSELVSGPFGLREPSADAPRIDPAEVDAVIVPGVAFDEHGRRLGYGGGYYDRLLPLLRPDCARIGLAFDEQLLPQIPAEEHDEHVDLVVTPTRVIRAR